jgi:peptidoglycan/LPS O-acetylase OafA/YrhL
MVPLLMYLRLRYVIIITLISMFAFTFLEYEILYGYVNLIWAWPFLIGVIIAAKKRPLYAIPLLVLSIAIVYYQKHIFKDSLSLLTVSLAILICLIALYVKLDLSKSTKKLFDFFGTISYPMYLIHMPIYLLLYYLGLRESYFFIILVLLLSIAINYIFDVWLKKVFWKPLVNYIESQIKEYKIKRLSNKISKA